jgi:hypothetical protein
MLVAMMVPILKLTYERHTVADKAHDATCVISEDSVTGLVSIELQTSDRRMPQFFRAHHGSMTIARAHLDKVFPKSAGWTKTVVEA